MSGATIEVQNAVGSSSFGSEALSRQLATCSQLLDMLVAFDEWISRCTHSSNGAQIEESDEEQIRELRKYREQIKTMYERLWEFAGRTALDE